MMTEDPKRTAATKQEHEAAEHVAEAHRLLSGLKNQLDKHPDLEQAIANLELALSILATKTGGML